MRIWNRSPHNAFTDLIFFKNAFYCCFREGLAHVGKEPGKITILKSKNGKKWKKIASLSLPTWDLRDPFLSITPSGKLLLNAECCRYPENSTPIRLTVVTFSKDGKTWTSFTKIKLPGEWIWRITWHQGTAYAFAYNPHKDPWTLQLVTSKDGKNFKLVQKMKVPHSPSEATIRFLPDGRAVALLRTKRKAFIGTASPPYKKWRLRETRFRSGAPNFLILPDGRMVAVMRRFIHKKPKTALFEMTLEKLIPLKTVPSGGDTSYAGMVYKDNTLYVSYYSSHAGRASIYFREYHLS